MNNIGPFAEPRPGKRRAPRFGHYVYFIQAETLGLIKIGSAVEPMDRLYTLQIGSPDALTLLAVIRTEDDAYGTEKHLHRQFGEHRSHGEWFRPAPELLSYIAQHAVDYGALLARENRDALNTALCG